MMIATTIPGKVRGSTDGVVEILCVETIRFLLVHLYQNLQRHILYNIIHNHDSQTRSLALKIHREYSYSLVGLVFHLTSLAFNLTSPTTLFSTLSLQVT